MGVEHLKAWCGLGVQVAGLYAGNVERGSGRPVILGPK
jgi:hypothetical protein